MLWAEIPSDLARRNHHVLIVFTSGANDMSINIPEAEGTASQWRPISNVSVNLTILRIHRPFQVRMKRTEERGVASTPSFIHLLIIGTRRESNKHCPTFSRRSIRHAHQVVALGCAWDHQTYA